MVYSEKQNLCKWWIFAIMAIPLCTLLYFIGQERFNIVRIPLSISLLLYMLIVTSLIVFRFRLLIDEKGIECSFYLFFRIYTRVIVWKDISDIKIEKLNAIKDFGGWGIRYNLFSKTTGYIFFKSKSAISIKTDKLKLVISTNNSEAAASAISTYKKNLG
jgi:hypothetical protein